MKRYKDKAGNTHEYGISSKLIKHYGSLEKVLESRIEIEKLREMADEEFNSIISQILEAPKNTLNWEHNIAMLIGTARAHKANRDMYTIKEKLNV